MQQILINRVIFSFDRWLVTTMANKASSEENQPTCPTLEWAREEVQRIIKQCQAANSPEREDVMKRTCMRDYFQGVIRSLLTVTI
jgi:hypothetical protein